MLLNDQRHICHLDLDTFFVSVEVLKDSSLKGKPVMVGGTGGRGVVTSCNYEARRFGVRSGMPMMQARRLCPEAIVIAGDFSAYAQYSHMVAEIIQSRDLPTEQASIDEFYLELTGLEKYYGCYQWASELRQAIMRETGLPISMGVAGSKYVAKVATGEAKPCGKLLIEPDETQPFLDPLPVRKIPGVGPVLGQELAQLGIDRIRKLRQFPREVLERQFGKPGITLWQRARGIDHSLVIPHRQEKSISTESTFAEDSTDIVALKATLQRMTEGLAFTLRKNRKLTACIAVKIRYADFNTYAKQSTIAYTSNTRQLCRKAQELFDKLYVRRQRIRLIGVEFSNLVHGGHQASLFDDTPELLALDAAIDRSKAKYGPQAILTAAALGALTHHGGHRENYFSAHKAIPAQKGSGRDITDWIPTIDHWKETPDGF